MANYPKARPIRLDAEELAIVQRIKDAAPAGQTVSFSDAIRQALHFWDANHPVSSASILPILERILNENSGEQMTIDELVARVTRRDFKAD